jgi:hypothetical protein
MAYLEVEDDDDEIVNVNLGFRVKHLFCYGVIN